MLILAMALPLFVSAQEERKIDSVFQHYFKVIEIELGIDNLSNYPDLQEEVSLVNGETGYINKYYNEGVSFLECISKIKAPKSEKGINVESVVDEELLLKWKNWYEDNKDRITWNQRKSEPKISFFNRIFG